MHLSIVQLVLKLLDKYHI
jgi:Mrp family chromosome partitioning ATPase